MSLTKQNEGRVDLDTPEIKLDRHAVVDALTDRISKDVASALKHIDIHEVIGVLELIKISIGIQTVDIVSKQISDSIIGEEPVH